MTSRLRLLLSLPSPAIYLYLSELLHFLSRHSLLSQRPLLVLFSFRWFPLRLAKLDPRFDDTYFPLPALDDMLLDCCSSHMFFFLESQGFCPIFKIWYGEMQKCTQRG